MSQATIKPQNNIGEKLVIASHNAGKVREISALVKPLGISVISASDVGVNEPEENGDSFAANAIIKSENAMQISKLPSLADDSGLVIPALDGAPGIYSARWAGPKKDFSVAMTRIQKELGSQSTQAHFVCALALSIPSSEPVVFEGKIFGTLTFPPRGDKGFGYDPIFIPTGSDKTFAELDPDYKNSISHRAEAFKKFLAHL